MSYTIHTTPGFIISSRPSGEAGKLLYVFTKDLGLIRASAQGIRFEKSKLRPFIQDYSAGLFSFVRGKEYWRLTNAQETENAKRLEVRDWRLDKKELLARIALLLNRLLQGEDPHPELFETLDSLFIFIAERPEFVDKELSEVLETLVVTRILERMGYIASIANLNEYIKTDSLSIDILDEVKNSRTVMNRHINRALKESHL